MFSCHSMRPVRHSGSLLILTACVAAAVTGCGTGVTTLDDAPAGHSRRCGAVDGGGVSICRRRIRTARWSGSAIAVTGARYEDEAPLSVRWQSPNRVHVQAYQVSVACDGEHLQARIQDEGTKDFDGQIARAARTERSSRWPTCTSTMRFWPSRFAKGSPATHCSWICCWRPIRWLSCGRIRQLASCSSRRASMVVRVTASRWTRPTDASCCGSIMNRTSCDGPSIRPPHLLGRSPRINP